MFGFFSKNKGPFTATIEPSGQQITVKSGSSENLLKAALESGLAWPYNCRVGSCGSCKCKLVSGKIKPLNDFSYVLNKDELDDGYILACQTMLKSDVVIEVALEVGVELPKSIKTSGKIARVTPLTHDIVEVAVALSTPISDYLPGQYADIIVPGVTDKPRSYSFSKAPSHENAGEVSFFIRRVPNGQLTEWLHAGDHVGQSIDIEGPLGTFYLRKPDGPILLLGGGSGLAPIRALLQQIVDEQIENDVTLIFGARTQQDLYCLDEIQALGAKKKGKFNFVPVLSMEDPASGWSGAVGHSPDAIAPAMVKGKGAAQAYMCGPPAMIDAAVVRLKKLGVAENQIYFDKFLDASSMPNGRV